MKIIHKDIRPYQFFLIIVFLLCILLCFLFRYSLGWCQKTDFPDQNQGNYKRTNPTGMKKIITTTEAPAAIGPYSQAIEINGMLFVSGQIPINPGTGEIVTGNISVQTEQVIRNLEAIITAAGYTLNDVVKTTCYLSSMNDFQQFNEVYARHFTQKPARATVEVSCLPKNVKVEIEAVAGKGE